MPDLHAGAKNQAAAGEEGEGDKTLASARKRAACKTQRKPPAFNAVKPNTKGCCSTIADNKRAGVLPRESNDDAGCPQGRCSKRRRSWLRARAARAAHGVLAAAAVPVHWLVGMAVYAPLARTAQNIVLQLQDASGDIGTTQP